MAAVDHAKAGVASGVINASRQVGGALGIAVLGGIGATLAANAWSDKIAAANLPPARHALAEKLTPLVQGGRGNVIERLTGNPKAGADALDSFMQGVRGAFFVGACLLLVAAAVSFFGLRNLRSSPAPASESDAPAQVPIEV